MNANSAEPTAGPLTPTQWGELGGFILLLIGLSFISSELALLVGGGAILVLVIKGIIPQVGAT